MKPVTLMLMEKITSIRRGLARNATQTGALILIQWKNIHVWKVLINETYRIKQNKVLCNAGLTGDCCRLTAAS